MTDLATEPDRKARLRMRVRRHRPAHHLRDREITRAVRQLDHLLEQLSGVSKVECTFHSGQVPPNFENGKVPEEKRFETLPALSTRSMKKGMPRALGRDNVVRRWQTCSNPTLKRCASTWTS